MAELNPISGELSSDRLIEVDQETYDIVKSHILRATGASLNDQYLEALTVIITNLHHQTKRPIEELIRHTNAPSNEAILELLGPAVAMMNRLRPKSSQIGIKIDAPQQIPEHIRRNMQ